MKKSRVQLSTTLNLKKLLAKVPGGSSRIATYAAALLLLKEQNNVSEELIENLDEVYEEYLKEAQMLNEAVWTTPHHTDEHDEVHTQASTPSGTYPSHVHKMLNHLKKIFRIEMN